MQRGAAGRPGDAELETLSEQHNKFVEFIPKNTAYLLYYLVTDTDMRKFMKYSEFRRWLERQGVQFTPGKGSHFKIALNDKYSVFPDHGAKEIGKGLVEKIKKDLGMK